MPIPARTAMNIFIARVCQKNLTISQIAKKWKVSPRTVSRTLQAAGLTKIRDYDFLHGNRVNAMCNKIVRGDMSIARAAKENQISTDTVERALAYRGLDCPGRMDKIFDHRITSGTKSVLRRA